MKHIVGFSGGIDSQACARWVLNRYPAEDVILMNTDAGGNEHPITVEFVHHYSQTVHPVVMIQALVEDMEGSASKKIAEFGLAPADPLTFDLLAKLKGRFPARRAQFCTYHLKIAPQRRWIATNVTDEYCRYTGRRRDESTKRADTPFREWDEYFDCDLHNPIADWTKKMCFEFVQAHGEPINTLYTLGFNRVGCAPCVNSGKEDILAWEQRFPEMIDKVRRWEQANGTTYFPPMVPGKADGSYNFIDEVVAWSKTVRGGKQMSLRVLEERPACESKYGLCE